MGEGGKVTLLICGIILTLEVVSGSLSYCRNHTFDRPTDDEVLHFSKENSEREFGIYDKLKCLHCCAHGYRSIEWFKDGQPYPWPTDVCTLIIHPESGNQTIYSQRLSPADSGKYWCIARNNTHFIRHEVVLQVSGPSISMGWPKTTYKPRDQEARIGDSVRFYCEAFVGTIDLPDYESEISWERYDQNESFTSGGRISQKSIFREEKRIIGSYLTFKEVRDEDYGKYTCRVRNLGDQVVKLSAWLSLPGEPTENPQETFEFRNSVLVVVLLVLTAFMSTITVLQLVSYLRMRRNRVSGMSLWVAEEKKELLIVYHENDGREALKAVLPSMRNLSSCCLHPVSSRKQIGEDDLKAKANSYQALLALISPSLVEGEWTSENIHLAIQTLLKVHFTVICVFLEGLPPTSGDSPDEQLLKDSLAKIHYVDRSKDDSGTSWNSLQQKMFFRKRLWFWCSSFVYLLSFSQMKEDLSFVFRFQMVKMMVTVVVVFTICWLPFNVMQLFLDYEEVRNWSGLPYLWFSFHWLAMSHACYNPVIYAFMNNRFKIGFIGILSKFQCARHLLSKHNQKALSGLAMAGMECAEYSLHRRPTTTTYLSVKKKAEGNLVRPPVPAVSGRGVIGGEEEEEE